MSSLIYPLLIVALVILAARFIPADSEPFHEDPATPEKQRSEVRLIGREAPRFAADAETVLQEFSRIARRDWRVGLVDGSIDEGMMTFVARSTVFGFRDYITVKATDEAGGSKLSIFARPRFNVYDWGVNAKRLDRWLGKLEQALDG
ncbi:MAG: DUF1499 domain-containing protein [Pseudomonadota bacterium]